MKVPGLLQLGPDNELRLTLTAPLTRLEFLSLPNHDVIFGVSSTRPITLHGCHTSRVAENHVEIIAGAALIGAHFPSIDEVRFHTLGVEMDSLHAWLRPQEYLTVDDGPEPGSKVINPSRGAPTDLVVGWGDFRIHFEASGAGIQVPWESDRIVLQRLAFLELKGTLGERSFLDLFAVIKSLRQLVALGLGASVRIQSIYGYGSQTKVRLPDGTEREIAVKIIAPQLPLGQASNQYHFFELFTAETLGESFGGAVSNWLDASERLRPVYDLIFSPYERPAPALELRFLELIHALEAHHRYVRGGQFMAADAYRQSVYAPLVAAIPAPR